MSFREKSAWISFVLLLATFLIYAGRFAWVIATHSGERDLIHIFLALVGGLVVLEIVLHVIAAMTSPGEARLPKDERERLIAMRATQAAFPVLIFGALASIGTMHLGARAWMMGHTTLLAIVVAELVKFGTEIRLYRRDR